MPKNRTVTLVANGEATQKRLDGGTTKDFFTRFTGGVPSAGQIRVNGAEFVGSVEELELEDGMLIQVLSEAVADKGVAGA